MKPFSPVKFLRIPLLISIFASVLFPFHKLNAAPVVISDFSAGVIANDLNGFSNSGTIWSGAAGFKFASTTPVRVGQTSVAGGVVFNDFTPSSANYSVMASTYVVSSAGSVSLIARAVNAANYYLAVFDYDAKAIIIYKSSGSFTTLGSASFEPSSPGSTDTVALTVFGNTLYAKYNGTVLAMVTDSSYTSAGKVGFRNSSNNFASSTAGVLINNLSVELETTATSFSVIGPKSGHVGYQSSNFTIIPNGIYTGTITITPSGAGLTSPTTLTFNATSAPQVFSLTPPVLGTTTLVFTNNGSLSNPSNLNYVSNKLIADFSTGVPSNSLNGFSNSSITWTGGVGAFKFLTTTPVRLGESNSPGATIQSDFTPTLQNYRVTASTYVASQVGDVSLIARASSTNYYLGTFIYGTTTATAVIYKSVGGSFTVLATGTFTPSAAGSTDQLAFKLMGPTLSLEKNGATVLSTTDSTYSNAGRVGLRNGGGAISTATTSLQINNLSIEYIFGPGTITVSSTTLTQVSLSATNASGGSGSYAYQWHRSLTPEFVVSSSTEISGATSVTLTDVFPSAGKVYYYKLQYTDTDFATTTVSSQQAVIPHAGTPSIKIYADGDSVTAYSNNYATFYSSDISSAAPNATTSVFNVAVSGQSQAQMLSDLQTQILSNNPDILTISTFLNDISTPTSTLVTNIRSYVNNSLAHINPTTGLPPQLILMTDNLSGQELAQPYARPIADQQATHDTVLATFNEYASNPNVRIVDNFADFYALGVDSASLYAVLLNDKVHPNIAGYNIFHNNLKDPILQATTRVVSALQVAPIISDVASSTTQTTASIAFATDKLATSSIQYGLTTGYGTTASSSVSATSSTYVFSGLTSNTEYNFKIFTRDSAGNISSSSNLTFKTASPAVQSAPIVTYGGSSGEYLYVAPVATVPVYTCDSKTKTCVISYVQSPTTQPILPTAPASYVRDLKLGMTGSDVQELQRFLNKQGFIIAKTGTGSIGKETNKFGPATQAALVKFQKFHKINPALGYYGSVTKSFVQKLIQKER